MKIRKLLVRESKSHSLPFKVPDKNKDKFTDKYSDNITIDSNIDNIAIYRYVISRLVLISIWDFKWDIIQYYYNVCTYDTDKCYDLVDIYINMSLYLFMYICISIY